MDKAMSDISKTSRLPSFRIYAKKAIEMAGFGAVLLLLAAWIATAGIKWSVFFHPDEPTIARWFLQVANSGYITDRAYPGGWFELHRLHGCPYASATDETAVDGANEAADDRIAETDGRDEGSAGRNSKPSGKIARWLENHVFQDGLVYTGHASTYRPMPTLHRQMPAGRRVQDGRDFNAILYVVSVLFVFLACLEAGMRPVSAFVSGLFFCASAAPIEFCHYCETDAGMIFSLSFFTWISARTLRRDSPVLALASGFSAGFAVACKFSLAPLVIWCLILPAVLAVRRKGSLVRRLALALSLAAGSLALAAFGYVAGTPAIVLAPEWYAEALRHASNRTYSEIVANLGGIYNPWAAAVIRASQFIRETARIGALPILWGLFSWIFWFRPAFRKQAVGVPLLLPLLLPFAMFAFPFVRNQETLHVPLIFAFGAGLPLEWWLRHRKETSFSSNRSRTAAAICAVLCVFALADGALRAHGMISCFRSRDTRAEAQNWLLASMPSGMRLGYDRYTGQAVRGVPCAFEACHALPYRWLSARAETNLPPYFIENVGFEGRLPIRNLRTGRLLPSTLANLEAWRNESLELRRWTFPKGLLRPTFAQPDIRIVSLSRPSPAATDIQLAFDRPVFLLPPGTGLYDSEGAPGLGAARALTVVGRRASVHVSRSDAERWLVTRMLRGSGEAQIVCERPFRPAKSLLRAGGAIVAEWHPAFGKHVARLLARSEAFPSARIRMRGDDQTQICAAQLCSDPAEAARILRKSGEPASALEFLDSVSRIHPLDSAAQAEAFLAARELGKEPDQEWIAAAKAAIAAASVAQGKDEVSIRGIPMDAVRDFSRLRLSAAELFPGALLPIFLPPGEYDVFLPLPASRSPDSIPPRILENQMDDFTAVEFLPERFALCCRIRVKKGAILRCADIPFEPFKAPTPEISWDPLHAALDAAAELDSMSETSPPRL